MVFRSPFGNRRDRNSSRSNSLHRPLGVQSLEERRLLAITLPYADAVMTLALNNAVDLNNYSAAQLEATAQWAVGFQPGMVPSNDNVATLIPATVTGTGVGLQDTLIVEFAPGIVGQAAANLLATLPNEIFAYPLVAREWGKLAVPNDPYFRFQWHLENTGQTGGTVGADSNIVDVWDNYTGAGIVVGIVDDGLQFLHPDLFDNYRADLSHDYNGDGGGLGEDSDPRPVNPEDNHGTAVGGVAAATGNNGIGVSGTAPGASLAGLRFLAGPTTDAQQASAVSFQNQQTHIYNNSWGPAVRPGLSSFGPMLAGAIRDDALLGRGGRGNIVLFAAGNSKQEGDNTNYSHLANSRYVLTVAAIDDNGLQTYYSNPGASLFVAAGSNSAPPRPGITTTDRTGLQGYNNGPGGDLGYTSEFGGTSSATPLVSGVMALLLEANPNLTYRDVMSILAESSEKNDAGDSDWRVNGAGHHVNHKYGFGAIDASASVTAAETWTPVLPEQAIATPTITVNRPLPDGGSGVISTATVNQDINVEWVEITLNGNHESFGNLQIELTSPGGTTSILAVPHTDTADFSSWVFTTNRNWGESSRGQWQLKVTDEIQGDVGSFGSWQMNVFGPVTDPPRAADDAASTAEDTPVAIDVLANDYDPDGTIDKTSVTIDTAPANGRVVVNRVTGVVTYTPNLNFVGVDTFTYRVTDNEGAGSRAALVSVTVSPSQDPPVANNDLVQGKLDAPVLIDVLSNDVDVDGTIDPTTVTIVVQPQFGTVSVNPATGVVTYTPAANFPGNDTFQYTVRDNDNFVSNAGLVTLVRLNSAPTATDDTAATSKNDAIEISPLANDSDSDGTLAPGSLTIIDSPAHGALAIDFNTGKIVYTPALNYFGPDAFTYTIDDNLGATSNVATVDITVSDTGPPVALDQEFIVAPGSSAVRVIALNADPQDVGNLTVRLVRPPLHGSISLAGDGTFSYSQDDTFIGLDTFTYVVNDGSEDSNVAEIRVASSDFAAVRKLYDDLLDRGASDDETLFWSHLLKQGISRQQIVNGFLGSDEYRATAVNGLYRQLLGRTADDDGLIFWVGQLGAGATLERVTADLAGSDEYYFAKGGTDAGFVNGLYADLLGRSRPPSTNEQNAWLNSLAAGASRTAVAFSFATTREYRANMVRGYYFDYLSRTVDNDGLNYWVAHMQFGQPREFVQRGLLVSNEYFVVLR